MRVRGVLWWLVAACLAWAGVSWFSNANLDGYHDMLENYAWAQPLRWGTHKHPPFFAWVVGLWFAVLPQADLAYRLLSYANVFVGLLGVWALGRRLRLGALAPWGALLLLWSLPYTNLAGKFNANSQLLSLWPWAAALLLASWQERGCAASGTAAGWAWWRRPAMLSKYYSGVFLAGFLLPTLLHADGRRWLATPRPYLALAVFGLALWPHLAWVAAHDWAPLGYAMDQGGGGTSWRYVARFALAPLFYWLPAWLALCLVWAQVQARHDGAPWGAHGRAPAAAQLAAARLGRCAVLARLHALGADAGLWRWPAWWSCPRPGPSPLAMRLRCCGCATCSCWRLPPPGYGAAAPGPRLVAGAHPGAGVGRGGGIGQRAARRQGLLPADAGCGARHRQMTGSSATPASALQWVGGDWAENAMLAFYAQPGLLTVPGLPDTELARLSALADWQRRNGLLLCPLGPVTNPQPETDCQRQAQDWLAARGLPAGAHVLQVQRSGWRFPRPQAWAYAVYDVDASEQLGQSTP